MPLARALAAPVTAWAIAGAAPADPPRAGSYEIQVRMEIPNVDAWSWTTTERVCIADRPAAGALPIPVLSPNNPFRGCRAEHVERDAGGLRYEIACDGRGSSRARAAYTLLPDGFRGRIDMVLGAKNMTMRELQVGRRLGNCSLADGSAG